MRAFNALQCLSWSWVITVETVTHHQYIQQILQDDSFLYVDREMIQYIGPFFSLVWSGICCADTRIQRCTDKRSLGDE